jgi:hypothetical protein
LHFLDLLLNLGRVKFRVVGFGLQKHGFQVVKALVDNLMGFLLGSKVHFLVQKGEHYLFLSGRDYKRKFKNHKRSYLAVVVVADSGNPCLTISDEVGQVCLNSLRVIEILDYGAVAELEGLVRC